eukprot:gene35837-48192_t
MSVADLEAFLHREFPQAFSAGDITIESADGATCLLRQAYSERMLRPGGTVSGPTLMALADFAMYVVLLSAIGPVGLARLHRPGCCRPLPACCHRSARLPMPSAGSSLRRRADAVSVGATFGRYGVPMIVMRIVCAAALLVSGAAAAKQGGKPIPDTIIHLGTATPGGGFPVYGDAFVAAMAAADPTLTIAPRNTKGSYENIPLLEAGQLDLGLVAGEPAYEAFMGIGRKPTPLKILTAISSNPGMFVVRADSPYRTIRDLTGLPILARYVLDGLGLDQEKDFTAVYLDRAGDGPAMVQDGRVAAQNVLGLGQHHAAGHGDQVGLGVEHRGLAGDHLVLLGHGYATAGLQPADRRAAARTRGGRLDRRLRG